MTNLPNLLRALTVVCPLSISAVSVGQSLIVYEGTATVRAVSDSLGLLPFAVAVGDEFRFRTTVDSSTQASSNPALVDSLGGVFYEGAIRDLAIWIDAEPVPLPSTEFDPLEFNNLVWVRNDAYISPSIPRHDLLYLIWRQVADDAKVYEFIFNLEDNVDAVMLSSTAIPTVVDYSLSNGSGIGFNVYAYEGGPRDFLDMVVTDFVAEQQPSVSGLLQQLLTDSTGVGPGKSLANKVALAQTYYAVPDIQSTCAVLKSFLHEVTAQSGKKLTTAQAQALSGDAAVIMRTMACE